jgi:hypothetical protein
MTITFSSVVFSTVPERLTLCFENIELAESWRRAILKAIGVADTLQSSQNNKLNRVIEDSPLTEQEEEQAGPAQQSTGQKNLSGRTWCSVHHVNGVSIYSESRDESHAGGDEDRASMASVVVRSPPRVCFQALVHQQSLPGCHCFSQIPFVDQGEILQVIDSKTQIVRYVWGAEGDLASKVLAPREMIAIRTWRMDNDGTYIILFQSVSSSDADVILKSNDQSKKRHWRRPNNSIVRANIQAAGFTVAPLRQEYVGEGRTSQECLVTVVVKADMGLNSFVSKYLPSLASAAHWALLEPMLLSIITLRDRVEQSRFMVLPTAICDDVVEEESVNEWEIHGEYEDIIIKRIKDAKSGETYEETKVVVKDESRSNVALKVSMEVDEQLNEIENAIRLSTTEKRFWSSPGNCNLKIRGHSYLRDKVKVPALNPLFDLYASDLVNSDEPLWDLCSSLPSLQACSAPFAFVFNLIYPANGMLQSLVTTWTAPLNISTATEEEVLEHWGDDPQGTVRAFYRNFKPWMEGDGPEADRRRNTKLKLIPRVAQGSWVVRQSVGTTPVLLGQKLKTKYLRGQTERGCSYFQVTVDVTSNTVANSVTKLVVNSITSLVVDLAPLIEGQAPGELPERLLGSVRYDHLDLKTAYLWDDANGGLVAPQ